MDKPGYALKREQLVEAEREVFDKMSWYLSTNHLNLAFMLGSDLVLGSKGFGNKYFLDVMADCRGWIPLFANKVSKGLAGNGRFRK